MSCMIWQAVVNVCTRSLLTMHLWYDLNTSSSCLNLISHSLTVLTTHPPACTWDDWCDQKLMIGLTSVSVQVQTWMHWYPLNNFHTQQFAVCCNRTLAACKGLTPVDISSCCCSWIVRIMWYSTTTTWNSIHACSYMIQKIICDNKGL